MAVRGPFGVARSRAARRLASARYPVRRFASARYIVRREKLHCAGGKPHTRREKQVRPRVTFSARAVTFPARGVTFPARGVTFPARAVTFPARGVTEALG